MNALHFSIFCLLCSITQIAKKGQPAGIHIFSQVNQAVNRTLS